MRVLEGPLKGQTLETYSAGIREPVKPYARAVPDSPDFSGLFRIATLAYILVISWVVPSSGGLPRV
jgi:hypothetical protein